ncbi:MAG: hypothetical protein ACOCQX_00005 [Candidatus Nanoarchaeia archaeon]
MVAILSYITIIGWIIALVLHQENKTSLGSFHLRQALLLMIAGLVLTFIPIIGWLLNIVVFVFWIMGLVYAIQKQEKEVPLIGGLAQQWFHMI